jgi:hypothetical protein
MRNVALANVVRAPWTAGMAAGQLDRVDTLRRFSACRLWLFFVSW